MSLLNSNWRDAQRQAATPFCMYSLLWGSKSSFDLDSETQDSERPSTRCRPYICLLYVIDVSCLFRWLTHNLFNVVSCLPQVMASSLGQSLASFCVNSVWERYPPTTLHLSESDAFRPSLNQLCRARTGHTECIDYQEIFLITTMVWFEIFMVI